ncbi:hypothetical protein CH295_02470 [Rhodococcus sp. 14-2483-1-2]|nr:hypothetical protein CH295_02470 [Rhodococcus sp. 14-2483-1-2]
MRFVYFIGETFRRATEGRWVAVPQSPPKRGALQTIDVEYKSGFSHSARTRSISEVLARVLRLYPFENTKSIAVQQYSEYAQTVKPFLDVVDQME